MIIEQNVSLHKFTTFKIGGLARYFCRIGSIDDLSEAFDFANTRDLPIFILGGGSNILISDEGFSGLVIKIELKGISFEKNSNDEINITVAAGENWDSFVQYAVENNLYGIENLSHIPGTVGGAVAQNIGAYDVEVCDAIEQVEVFDIKTLKSSIIKNKECKFKYRNSFFKTEKGRDLIITKVYFSLKQDGRLNTNYKDVQVYFNNKNKDDVSLKSMRQAIFEIRKNKFPDLKKTGTAGSFFKNPIITKEQTDSLLSIFPDLPHYVVESDGRKVSLAWILDNICSIKGLCLGNIGVFKNQSLVLVNHKNGKAKEIKSLADKIINDVKDKTGIEILPEVVFVGKI